MVVQIFIENFMKKLIYYSLTAILLFSLLTVKSFAGKYGMFTEFLGPNQQLTQFYVPGGPNSTDPYKVIIAFHPYNTPPEAIMQMVMPSAENYNAILVCPNVHPDYSGDISESIMTYLNENYSIDNENLVLSGYSAGGVAMFDYGLPNYTKVKGLIGIAPSINIYQSDYQYLDKLPISVIVGTDDHLYSGAITLKGIVEERGGSFFLVEKQGVAHTGAYFYSMEFTQDWNSCYDFIQSWMPRATPITLLTPENGAENLDIQIDFTWKDNELADSYKIQIADNIQFDPVTEEYETEDTEYTSRFLKNGKSYYWRVCGLNSSGDGLWSNTYVLSTKPFAPPAPELVNPQNGATNVLFPVALHWNSVETADKYIVRLWLSEEEEPQFEAELQEVGLESYIQTAPCDPGNEYKWQVEAINVSGSSFSPVWKFITLSEPAEIPELLYPEEGSENIPVDLELRWKKINEAESYTLDVYSENSQEPLFHKTDIKSSSQLVKTTLKLQGGIKYYWHVCGVNNAGDGPWSIMRTFTTEGTSSVIELNDGSLVHPTPFYSQVSIDFESDITGRAKVLIYDENARVIHHEDMFVSVGTNSFNWYPENIRAGVYLYHITILDKEHKSGKLIKIE
jgi:hypothetical protein